MSQFILPIEIFEPAGVLKALAHAYGHGVVHRDIKPSNVMLSEQRTVKIMDFGLAKVLREAKARGESARE